MNIKERGDLKNFILDASRATYASGNKLLQEKQNDGSTTIQYEKGAYKYHDNLNQEVQFRLAATIKGLYYGAEQSWDKVKIKN